MIEPLIENGMAKLPAGEWLVGATQPAATKGRFTRRGQRGFIVPDRAAARVLKVEGDAWFASAERPFLTRLTALPDQVLSVASAKLLVAPLAIRKGARSLKPVPLSFNHALPVTEFLHGWVVIASAGRVTKVEVADGETLTVRPEALVAWIGKTPSGFCPKLSVVDMILPRGPKELAFNFHGPATVWLEGGK